MNYSYYPGCTLKTKATELDTYARDAATALGVTMDEVPQWQCCGAVYPMAKDEIATRLSSVRALDSAKRENRDLLTLCSACHHVLKRVNNDMKTDKDMSAKVQNYLQLDEKYTGETRVVHYLEMLRDDIGFDELRKKVVSPLTGRKIGAYYGCLLLRPSKVMAFDNPEDPSIMEEFIEAIGAMPVRYPYRNECCGGYSTLGDREAAGKMCGKVLSSATGQGAKALITACPLCMYNLDAHKGGHALPVYYFTELLAEALGVKEPKGEMCLANQ